MHRHPGHPGQPHGLAPTPFLSAVPPLPSASSRLRVPPSPTMHCALRTILVSVSISISVPVSPLSLHCQLSTINCALPAPSPPCLCPPIALFCPEEASLMSSRRFFHPAPVPLLSPMRGKAGREVLPSPRAERGPRGEVCTNNQTFRLFQIPHPAHFFCTIKGPLQRPPWQGGLQGVVLPPPVGGGQERGASPLRVRRGVGVRSVPGGDP